MYLGLPSSLVTSPGKVLVLIKHPVTFETARVKGPNDCSPQHLICVVESSTMASTCTPSQGILSHAVHSHAESSPEESSQEVIPEKEPSLKKHYLEESSRGELSQQGSVRSESSQGTPPSSESSICKEKPSVEPGYVVEQLDDKDNAGYFTYWKYRLNQLLPLTAVSAIAAYWLYITYRVRCTVITQRTNHTIYPVAWLFLAVEVGVASKPSDDPRLLRIKIC